MGYNIFLKVEFFSYLEVHAYHVITVTTTNTQRLYSFQLFLKISDLSLRRKTFLTQESEIIRLRSLSQYETLQFSLLPVWRPLVNKYFWPAHAIDTSIYRERATPKKPTGSFMAAPETYALVLRCVMSPRSLTLFRVRSRVPGGDR